MVYPHPPIPSPNPPYIYQQTWHYSGFNFAKWSYKLPKSNLYFSINLIIHRSWNNIFITNSYRLHCFSHHTAKHNNTSSLQCFFPNWSDQSECIFHSEQMLNHIFCSFYGNNESEDLNTIDLNTIMVCWFINVISKYDFYFFK